MDNQMKKLKSFLSKCLLAGIFVLFVDGDANAQSEYFGKWPAGTSPKTVGERLVENWVKRDFEFQSGKRPFLIYAEVCT